MEKPAPSFGRRLRRFSARARRRGGDAYEALLDAMRAGAFVEPEAGATTKARA